MRFYEHTSRSLVKTLTYRFLIIISTAITTFLITGNPDTTAAVTVMQTIVSSVIYYLHERLWNGIHWGRKHKK